MPDILNDPNLKLIVGAVAAILALFAPKLWEKLKPFIPSLSSINPFSSPSQEIVVNSNNIHDIIHALMEDRKVAKDEEGKQLIGTFGKHLYDIDLAKE